MVLRALSQWVLWRWERQNGKLTKVPYTAAGYRASSTNSATWNRLEVLLPLLARRPGQFAGVGFVVTSSDPVCGLDIDHSLTDAGTVKLWAVGLLKRFADCYVEITPSGAGLRVWCLANTLRGLKRALPDGQIEVYSSGRYFTVTGNRFGGAPLAITDHQADVDRLVAYFEPAAPNPSGSCSGRILEKIPAGDRYRTFCSIAGTLVRRGVCDQAIEAAILAINEHQADPSKSDLDIRVDLRKILSSARRWS
jgi:hypothetical protein